MNIKERLSSFWGGAKLALYHYRGSQFADWEDRLSEESAALDRLRGYPEFGALVDSIESRQRYFMTRWKKADTAEDAERIRQNAVGFDLAIQHVKLAVSANQRRLESIRQAELHTMDGEREREAIARANIRRQNQQASRRSA